MSEALKNLLDLELDDLEDMPSFEPFPNGAHVVTIKFEQKEVNKKSCVELTMTAVETQELENPAEDTPLKAGSETGVLFMLDNEFGQGSFKAILKPLAAATGIKNVGELMEAVKGMQALVVTKKRANKNNPDQVFTQISNIQLL